MCNNNDTQKIMDLRPEGKTSVSWPQLRWIDWVAEDVRKVWDSEIDNGDRGTVSWNEYLGEIGADSEP
jgi:hypothetical protein